MIDLNSDEYLQKLSKAAASEQGQIIIEFLKYEAKEFDYDNFKKEDFKDFSTLGMEFLVKYEINQYFKTVLSRLDKAE